MNENNYYIDDLITRFLSGKTSPKENKVISKWIQESSENKIYFINFKNLWLAATQIDSTLYNTDFQKLNKLATVKELPIQKSNFGIILRPVLRDILKVAAVLLIAILIGAIGYRQLSIKQISDYQNSVIVESILGSKAITTLPDGTKVWLNGGSKLTYNKDYNGKIREVNLIGEAYFDVITNPSKPFVVKAGKLAIKALGTSFNVKAYPEDKTIVTTLVKGKVIIEGNDNSNKPFTIEMIPKETVIYNKTTILGENGQNKQNTESVTIKPKMNSGNLATTNTPFIKQDKVKTELYTSWKDERWIIEKQAMENLSKDLERRYNIKILVLSPEIRKFHFTGTIENETIEQIMAIMRRTIPIKYNIDKGIVTIREDKMLMNEFRSKN